MANGYFSASTSTPATLSLAGWFGDGSDGDLTIGAGQTVSLSANKQYANITIAATGVLQTNGWIVRCSGTVTNDGVIHDDGNDASGASIGATLSATGTRTAGHAAGTGRATTGVGAAGTNGTVHAYSWYNPAGGSGGSVTGYAGGAGTTAVAGGSTTALDFNPIIALEGRNWIPISTTTRYERGGGGGGGGGNNGATFAGAGGGGGGKVLVLCNTLAGSGVFRARGGNGGNGTAGGGSCGGGGGGSGGQVIVCASVTTNWSGTLSVPGGSPGTGTNETVAATAGGTGSAVLFNLKVNT